MKLDFTIEGYQFPDIASGFDANWLVVGLVLRYRDKVFKQKDPSITTDELRAIHEWFLSISKNEIPTYVTLDFLEPNLAFQLLRNQNGMILYGIQLSLECKPPFVIEDCIDDECVLVFENSHQEMENYAEHFHSLSKAFPVRIG